MSNNGQPCEMMLESDRERFAIPLTLDMRIGGQVGSSGDCHIPFLAWCPIVSVLFRHEGFLTGGCASNTPNCRGPEFDSWSALPSFSPSRLGQKFR